MKNRMFPGLVAALLVASSCGTLNTTRALQGGLLAAQALTLSDEQVREYVGQWIEASDKANHVLPESDSDTKRLRRITKDLTEVDGVPLDFKVYQTAAINAFACADGSVRVYSGLMEVMTDEQILGVIGHEIGHVALKHSKKEMQNALLRSAALEGLASTSYKIARLTDSQLGAIGSAILGAQYSKAQETEADDYAYDFLVSHGKNPWCLAMAFEKLKIYTEGGSSAPAGSNLLSSHPDTDARIKRVSERAAADGYKRPY